MNKLCMVIAVWCVIVEPVYAASLAHCKKIHWRPGNIFILHAALHKATHLRLPNDLMASPVVGNSDLWNVEGQASHVFIKPNTTDPEGSETTLSIIAENNQSYDFVLKRVAQNPDTCVQIVDTHNQQGGFQLVDKNYSRRGSHISALETEIKHLKTQQSETMAWYRGQVYTRYHWSDGHGFMGKHIISDVWDDGRFTYIRLLHDNRGLLSLAAKIDRDPQLVDYKYDSLNKLYVVTGIYPSLLLQAGDSKVWINRLDNNSYS